MSSARIVRSYEGPVLVEKSLREMWRSGRDEGFPRCCVAHFCWDTWRRRASADLRGTTAAGCVPCAWHAGLLTEAELQETYELLIQMYSAHSRPAQRIYRQMHSGRGWRMVRALFPRL